MVVKNTRAEKEVSDLYHMEDWDNEPEAEAIIQKMPRKKMDTETEKIITNFLKD